jgi:DNA-binding GntR family transcriptional regulator
MPNSARQTDGVSPLPAYARLRGLLRAAIERGEYDAGRALPTEVRLMEMFGVSRHTVRQAIHELAIEGLVRKVQGSGTFATGAHHGKYVRAIGNVSDLMVLGVDTTLRLVEPLRETRNDYAATRLGEVDDTVVAMTVVRYRHDLPLGIATSFLPMWVGTQIAPLSPAVDHHVTVIELVQRAIGRDVVDAEQEVTAVEACAELALRLKVAEGSPLLRIERLYHLETGEAVEFAISHYRPDRYSYRISLRGTSGR